MMDAKYEESLDRARHAKELAEGIKAPVITAEQGKKSPVDELLSLAGRYGIERSIALLRSVLRDIDAERGVYNGDPKMYSIELCKNGERLLEESMFAHTGLL